MSTLYHCITHGEAETDAVLSDLLEDRDPDTIAAYLAKWDCGEYHDDPAVIASDPWGHEYDVNVPYSGTYVLAVNYAMGWASLHIAAKPEGWGQS